MPLGPTDEKGHLPQVTQEDVDGFGLRLKTPEERMRDFEQSVIEWAQRAPVLGDVDRTADAVHLALRAMGLPVVGVEMEEDRVVVQLGDEPAVVMLVRVA
jgi:hypothetical protein